MNFTKYLEQCLSRKTLSSQDHQEVFGEIFNQSLDQAQMAAALIAWRSMGETTELLVAGAKELLKRCNFPPIPQPMRPLADNCGTGGDGLHTFNISTSAALLSAACGVRVLKHGNRSVSSKCGSADLLFELGLPDSLSPDQTIELTTRRGFGFLFAPNIHPSIKAVMPVRKSLGIRTVFNLLGPLANPCRPDYQIIGVAKHEFLRPMAEALLALGVKRAAIVHSRDGMDELSPAAPSDVLTIFDGALKEMSVDPDKLGLQAAQPSLVGGDAKMNAQIFGKLKTGTDSGIMRAVVLNAGMLLWVSEHASDLKSGCQQAKVAIEGGKLRDYCDSYFSEFKK